MNKELKWFEITVKINEKYKIMATTKTEAIEKTKMNFVHDFLTPMTFKFIAKELKK